MSRRWVSYTATVLLVLMGAGFGLTCMYGEGLNIAARMLSGLAAAVCIYALIFLPRTTRVRVLMSFFPSMDSALESARSESADRKADRK
jgi:hypothetical protein